MDSAVATATGHSCKWASCRTICSSDQALYEHLLEDHTAPWQSRDVSPYQRLACQWTGCETEPNWQRLRDHLTTHTDYRPFVCNVSPNCTMRFKTSHTLHIHLKRKDHRRSPTIKSTPPCEWKACTETLANPPALFEHISKVHSKSGSENTCLWTECAHRSALKWKLHSSLPSWYKPILCNPDKRDNTFLMHAHINIGSLGGKKRKRKDGSGRKGDKHAGDGEDSKNGDAGTKGDANCELQVEAKRQRTSVLERDEPESEDDNIAHVEDFKDAKYTPGRRTLRRGAKRVRKSGDEDEEADLDVTPNGRTHKVKRLCNDDWNINDGKDRDVVHDDDSVKDADYAPSRITMHNPSPSSTSTFNSDASSPSVVTPEEDQGYKLYVNTVVDLYNSTDVNPSSNLSIAEDADERLATVELQVTTLEEQLAAALRVMCQSEVLRAEWAGRMSDSADDADVTAMILDQDLQTTRTTTEDDLESEPDDWSLWVTGEL